MCFVFSATTASQRPSETIIYADTINENAIPQKGPFYSFSPSSSVEGERVQRRHNNATNVLYPDNHCATVGKRELRESVTAIRAQYTFDMRIDDMP